MYIIAKKPKHIHGYHTLEDQKLPNGDTARVLVWHRKEGENHE